MITRDDIRELAQFQVNDAEACAISFYFQPRIPQNRSHKEEVIEAKELVRNAVREAEKHGRNSSARADLSRILEIAGRLQGNQARAKAIFACGARNIWREFDLPASLSSTQLNVNQRFNLKPLAAMLGAQSRLWIALLDRHRARIFDYRLDELREREGIFGTLPRRGRGDGFLGYDGGHAERKVANEALHHFKAVADRLREAHDKGLFEHLVVGCHDSQWPDFEAQLHPYVKQRLIGHFSAEVAGITVEQIRDQAARIVHESLEQRCHSMVREVLSQAKSNNRGVTGLRRVLRSLELGEVQTLLMSESYRAHAVECTGCGHLDAHMVRFCPVCGRATRELEDVCEAIIPAAIRRDIELFYVKNDAEFDGAGNIAALLRFRVDHARTAPIAAAM